MRFGFADTFACSNPLFHIFAAGALIEYSESVARRSHQMPTKRQKLEEALAVRWGRTWGTSIEGNTLLHCLDALFYDPMRTPESLLFQGFVFRALASL